MENEIDTDVDVEGEIENSDSHFCREEMGLKEDGTWDMDLDDRYPDEPIL